jgi:hypothetical protein
MLLARSKWSAGPGTNRPNGTLRAQALRRNSAPDRAIRRTLQALDLGCALLLALNARAVAALPNPAPTASPAPCNTGAAWAVPVLRGHGSYRLPKKGPKFACSQPLLYSLRDPAYPEVPASTSHPVINLSFADKGLVVQYLVTQDFAPRAAVFFNGVPKNAEDRMKHNLDCAVIKRVHSVFVQSPDLERIQTVKCVLPLKLVNLGLRGLRYRFPMRAQEPRPWVNTTNVPSCISRMSTTGTAGRP